MTDYCTTFLDLRIIASRDGDRVTGRVEFPAVHKREPVPIDYRSIRPATSPDPGSPIPDPLPAHDAHRLQAVRAYQKRLADYPDIAKGAHLQIVAREHSVSVRSVQLWLRKYETQGVDALRSAYVPRPKRVAAIAADLAVGAVKVAAYWSFRIGNVKCIDSSIIGVAVSLLERGFLLQDVVATIDAYYAHDCDRARYPFKPFARWAKYDFTKWQYRACHDNDYRRGAEASAAVDAKTRKRDVNCRANRQAVRALSNTDGSHPVPRSPLPDPGGSNTVRTARKLRSIGLQTVADDTVRRAAPGALAANDNPATVAEAMGRLDDGFRTMLIRAGQGDREAKSEAIATMPLWWPMMPAPLTRDLDSRIDAWQADHPHVTDEACASRKLQMFRPYLRDDRSGVQRLFPAARIPT